MEKQSTICEVHMEEQDNQEILVTHLNDCLVNWRSYSDIVLICIGTDRSTGDSLGPLIGDILNEKLKFIKIHGTLENPVHARNLEDTMETIEKTYNNPLIIGIDACLSRVERLGKVMLVDGPVQPGSSMKKDLPSVGNYSIKGIVNVSSGDSHLNGLVLQNTRLGFVMKMARLISNSIISVDKKIYNQEKRRKRRMNRKLSKLKKAV